MSRRTPRLFVNILNYFIDSIKPRQITGNFMGKDYLGNSYYEIPADPSRGKRRPQRWFKTAEGEDGFDSEKPAEWESWLRHRRPDPPTENEISKNLAIIHLKQKNAALLDEKYNTKTLTGPKDIKGPDSYPKYEEYHTGDDKNNK